LLPWKRNPPKKVWYLLQALERKKQDDEAHGEIESHHPGYLGSQDTFYVGTIKGVGRIYQQTFVDTYSKWAAAKLYTTKTPITGADLLNDRVLSFFASQDMGVIRILTDRGTEYCGKLEMHDYQLYLGINGIEHTKTKARHPQTNGICERFHKTVLHEFYQVAFRRKLYHSLEELQTDLDTWLEHYNIKGKCAVAERLCIRSLTENNSGWKRSDNSTNRTIGTIKTEPTVRSNLNYYKLWQVLTLESWFKKYQDRA